MSLQMSARRSSASRFSGTLALSIGFYALLSFALMRSMRIDAYELVQTRLDLMGYWVALLIAILLGARLLSKGRLQLVPLSLVFFLIFFAVLILVLTAPEKSPIAFLISRHGILTWFLLGVGCGGVFDVLQKARMQERTRLVKVLFIVAAGWIGALMVQFALQYLELPVWTINYQSVSSSAGIFLIMTVGAIDAIWGARKPPLLTIAYLVMGTIVAAAVVRMQSTSIALLWAGVVVIFLLGQLRNSQLMVKFLLIATLFYGAAYSIQTEVFEDISKYTRFSWFFEGGDLGSFSSVSSRLAILDSFAVQFAISPIWGNFQAEILSGAGVGNYVHSVPLSFLTHTGLIGATMFSLAVALLLNGRLFFIPSIDGAERQFGRLMLMLLALGTISAFLTWPILWFMMGTLCRRPATLVGSN